MENIVLFSVSADVFCLLLCFIGARRRMAVEGTIRHRQPASCRRLSDPWSAGDFKPAGIAFQGWSRPLYPRRAARDKFCGICKRVCDVPAAYLLHYCLYREKRGAGTLEKGIYCPLHSLTPIAGNSSIQWNVLHNRCGKFLSSGKPLLAFLSFLARQAL